MMLRLRGRTEEPARAHQRALAVWPEHAPAQTNLASILRERGRHCEAMRAYHAALQVDPNLAFVARLRVNPRPRTRQTCWRGCWSPIRQRRRRCGEEGVRLAERAVQLTAERDASALDTLAAAYAAIEKFARATTVAERAWRLASAAGQPRLASEIQSRLALYRAGKAYRR